MVSFDECRRAPVPRGESGCGYTAPDGSHVQYLWSGSGGLLTATRLWWEGPFPAAIEMRQPVMVASPGGGHIRLMVQHQPDDGDGDIAALCLRATEEHLARLPEQQRPHQR